MTADLDGRFDDADEDPGSGPQPSPVPARSAPIPKLASWTAPLSAHGESDPDDDDDYDDQAVDYEWGAGFRGDRAAAGGPAALKANRCQPADQRFRHKYENRINLRAYEAPHNHWSGPALNPVFEQHRKTDKERHRVKDKSDRATIENVLDPRTRMILFKLLDKKFIQTINGCISTGKEANVYHCQAGDGSAADCAVKIYKTSILVFKDRDKYVTGEHRFRSGYSKKNPRKMVRTWAEKEMRNLTRLHHAGIRCPEPILLRDHVLLMSFLGQDGWPAPRLHDAEIAESKARELYWDLVLTIRKIYHVCKLVHGDLSEYNLLFHNGKAFVIDVSQSVEHDHPHALEFLRTDLKNVTDFFRRKAVNVLGLKTFFDFVVDPTIPDDEQEERLALLDQLAAATIEDEPTAEDEIAENVFQQVHIARALEEIANPGADIAKVKAGEKELLYQTVTGVVLCQDQAQTKEDESESDDASESDSDGSEGSDGNDNVTGKGQKDLKNSRRPREESPNSRKERKKAVKDQQAAKRKEKIKKHVKKKKEKATKKK
ncbi:serine/threonine-protein kinase RIO1-like [Tigriopus californicus]|uniref:serine/threonine-protein kinase RIO1-like n=1 Tax=Tigriopus californicus TaxID=6832 RepID=UPI0027D9EFEA|nr:serine/threonine-protein kinase RIO1-like [Tigriopus californicus]